MNFAKSLFFGLSLALATCCTNYVNAQTQQSLNGAEKSTLAAVAVVDMHEIISAIVAENKSADSDVKEYAIMMIDQHGKHLTRILEMQNQLKTGAVHGSEAEKLAKQSKQDLMKLGGLQGYQFDTAYMDAMVQSHAATLKLIDDKLMKTAKSAEMKAFMKETRSVVAQHLEEAKKIKAQLKDNNNNTNNTNNTNS